MSKKNNQDTIKKPRVKFDIASIIVIAGAAIVTVLLLGLLIYNVSRPFKYAKYEDLKVVNYEDYKTQEEEEYYVFVLDNKNKKAPMIEDIVVEYANYARTHSSAKRIYLYDYRAEGNSNIINDLNISTQANNKLPGLVLIKKGSISTKFLNVSDLANELTKAMGK